jgi:hypothetical protein
MSRVSRDGDADAAKESSESLGELSDFDDLNELQERLNRDNRSASPPLSENQAVAKLDDMFGRRESIMLQLNEEEAIQKLNQLFAKEPDMEKSYYSNASQEKQDKSLHHSDIVPLDESPEDFVKVLKAKDSLTESQAEDKLDEMFGGNGGPEFPLNESEAEDKLDELFGRKGGPDVPLNESQAEDKLDELFGKRSESETPMSASYNHLGGIILEVLEAEKREQSPTTGLSSTPALASMPSTVIASAVSAQKDDKPFVMNLNLDGARKCLNFLIYKVNLNMFRKSPNFLKLCLKNFWELSKTNHCENILILRDYY